MNLTSIASVNRLLSYRATRRYMALTALIIILSPSLALAVDEGNTTEGIAEQTTIGQQGGCEAVCQLPDQASTWIPSSLVTQVETKESEWGTKTITN